MLNYYFIPVKSGTSILEAKNKHTSTFIDFITTCKIDNPPTLSEKPDKSRNGAIYTFDVYEGKELDQYSLVSAEDELYPDKFKALLHNGKEVVLWKTTNTDGSISYKKGRCDNAVKSFYLFKMDVDEQLSEETYTRVKNTLKKLNLNYAMHTSSSNNSEKECKVYDENGVQLTENGKLNGKGVKVRRKAYGFRIYIPYAKPLPNDDLYVHIRDIIYEDMRVKLGFDSKGINTYDTKASKNISQLMVPPYKLLGREDNYHYDTNTQGNDLNWSYAVDEATKRLQSSKVLTKQKEASVVARKAKEERFKLAPQNFQKKLKFNSNRHITNFDQFIENLGEHLDLYPYKFEDKHCYTCACPAPHHETNNNRKLMIIPNDDGTITTTCLGAVCPYHSTSKFLEDYETCIPTDNEDIDDYVEVIPIETKEHSDFIPLIGKLSENIPPTDTKSKTLIMAAPGVGKTHNTATKIYQFLKSVEHVEIHECPLMLIVVPTQALQNDLNTTYLGLYGDDLASNPSVTILRSGVAIKKNTRVIIAVQIYLGKMGHTTEEYKLIKYITKPVEVGDKLYERRLITIIDEADSFIESLQTSIQVGYRVNSVTDDTKIKSQQSFDVFHNQCPTARTCSFQCDRCSYKNLVEIVPNEIGVLERRPCVTTSELRYIKLKHDEVSYFIEDDDNELKIGRSMGSVTLKDRAEYSVAFDCKSHVFKSYSMQFSPVTMETEPTKYGEWVANSTYNNELIRVNDNTKHEQYALSYANYNSDSEEDDKRKKWYKEVYEPKLDELFKKDQNELAYKWMLPYHPCGSTWMRFYDLETLQNIIKRSDYVLCLSGTYTENQLNIYKHLLGNDITMIKISPEKEIKPIDELLAMVTTAKLDINAIDLQQASNDLRRYIELASPSAESYRDEIGFHLHIDHTKTYYEDQKKKDHVLNYFALLQNEGKTIPASAKTYTPSLVRTYAGSPYTRGANLGEYQSITYNFFSSYDLPMYALNTFNGDEVGFLRESAKVTGMLQALFRIMRKKKDPMTHQLTQNPHKIERRVMMVGDCKNVVVNPKSANTEYDYTKSIVELIRMKADDVAKNMNNVIFNEHAYLNNTRLFESMLKTRNYFLEHGIIKIFEEKFDENILIENGKFIRSDRIISKYPNILKITKMTADELEEHRKLFLELYKLPNASRRSKYRFKEKYQDFVIKFPCSDKLLKFFSENVK